MTITTERAQKLMKRCQIGVGGRNALEEAHDIMAECYGVIGALVAERDELRAHIDRVYRVTDEGLTRQAEYLRKLSNLVGGAR